MTGKLEYADYRISKSAWLREDLDPMVGTIRRRVSDYSGLALETAEELQVGQDTSIRTVVRKSFHALIMWNFFHCWKIKFALW